MERKVPTRESDIESKMRSKLRQAGMGFYKFTSPGTSGVPDRIVLVPGGRVIFVELKTKEGRLSDIQKVTQAKMRRQGAEIYTLYGWEDVEHFMQTVLCLDVGG